METVVDHFNVNIDWLTSHQSTDLSYFTSTRSAKSAHFESAVCHKCLKGRGAYKSL